MMDRKETLVPLVSLATPDPQESWGPEVRTELRETEERMESKEKLAPRDPPERTDPRDHLGRGALLEQKDLREDRGRRGPRETQVPLGPQERRAPWDPRDSQESQEPRGSGASLDLWGSRGLQVLPDRRALRDLWVLLVCPG